MIVKNIYRNKRIYNFPSKIKEVNIIKYIDSTEYRYRCNSNTISKKYRFGIDQILYNNFYINNDDKNDYTSILLDIKIDISNINNNFDILDDIIKEMIEYYDIDTSNLSNKYFSISFDVNIENNIFDRFYYFDKVNRLFKNKLFIINILRSNVNNNFLYNISDIKFINIYKIKKDNNIKYIIPILEGLNSIDNIFINKQLFETDITVNLQDRLNLEILDFSGDNTDISSIYNYLINFNIFDIFNNNFIVPKFIYKLYDRLEDFKFPYASDLFSLYFGSEFMDVFKSRIDHKITESYFDFINLNLNNLFLSIIKNKYPDYIFDDLSIIIFINNPKIRLNSNMDNNILRIADKYNINIFYDNTYDSSSYSNIIFNSIFKNNISNNNIFLKNFINNLNLLDISNNVIMDYTNYILLKPISNYENIEYDINNLFEGNFYRDTDKI